MKLWKYHALNNQNENLIWNSCTRHWWRGNCFVKKYKGCYSLPIVFFHLIWLQVDKFRATKIHLEIIFLCLKHKPVKPLSKSRPLIELTPINKWSDWYSAFLCSCLIRFGWARRWLVTTHKLFTLNKRHSVSQAKIWNVKHITFLLFKKSNELDVKCRAARNTRIVTNCDETSIRWKYCKLNRNRAITQ